jgi:uncharacterized protein (DUF2252 family)
VRDRSGFQVTQACPKNLCQLRGSPQLPESKQAPIVLSVGDLHIDSYGTWRDVEGRMCWGVDDFDEAWPLPYANEI